MFSPAHWDAGMAFNRLQLLALPLVAASLAFAACGDDDDSTTASAEDARAEFREATLEYARCMRERGFDVPDPRPGEGGGLLLEQRGPDTAARREADEECRKPLEKLDPPELSDEQEQEFRDRALEFARCMRGEGIDFPDPTFGEDGRVQMRLGAGDDPRQDPRFEEAFEKCSDGLGAPDELPAP
jgi:hypothetical protein